MIVSREDAPFFEPPAGRHTPLSLESCNFLVSFDSVSVWELFGLPRARGNNHAPSIRTEMREAGMRETTDSRSYDKRTKGA